MIRWLCAVAVVCGACGTDTGAAPDATLPKRVVVLTDEQYANAVHDLLGDTIVVPDIRSPGTQRHQFIHDDNVLAIDSPQLVQYRLAAEAIAPQVGQQCTDMACVERFATRAFRRPLDASDRDGLTKLFAQGGFPLVAEAVLQSASFVYRVEAGDAHGKLGAFELAAELGFLFLDSIPDDELWSKAREGTLPDEHVLAAQVDRLLATPRVQAHITDVVMRWLSLHDIENTYKDPRYHLSVELRHSMFEQERRFIDDVLWRRGGSLRELMTSNESYVDSQLAAWYPDVAPASWEMTPRTFNKEVRAGILTHPGVLTMLGTLAAESIIFRGIYVHRKFLCTEELGRPPFSAIVETASITKNFNEAQMGHFRAQHVYCSTCHKTIDPPGFALHSYDVLGRWRKFDGNEQEIEDDVLLPIDGTRVRVNGAAELGRVLSESDQVGKCVVGQLAHHALGRALVDPAMREYLQRHFENSDRNIVEVFRALATSPMFRTRRSR